MKRVVLAVAAVLMFVVAVVFSKNLPAPPSSGFVPAIKVEAGARNPWTHLRLNNDPADFRFVVVSDRTGGHREKVFSRAVEQINLLQPEFVLSVGDLIEGYSSDAESNGREWREFQGFVARLQMPFFYVAGNHDISNPSMAKLWEEKFGRRYYHFVYQNVLFLVLCSEDPPNSGTMSEEQVKYAAKVLEENAGVRWTVVALHRPIWAHANLEKNGWQAVEKLLAGRKYTVFAGHEHRYQRYVRQGMNHYQLATTGGGSRLRGVRYGEFDHIVQVTMKPSGPVLANIMLDGIFAEDMTVPETLEPVLQLNRQRCHPVRGIVYLDGVPAAETVVTFYRQDAATKKYSFVGDAFVEGDGSFAMSTYVAGDGAPAGEYAIAVQSETYGRRAKFAVPAPYTKADTSPLRATVKAGKNEFNFELNSAP